MTDQALETIAPLVSARDLLKAAHKVLSHAHDTIVDEGMRVEIDAVLNDLVALQLKLKAIGHDGPVDS